MKCFRGGVALLLVCCAGNTWAAKPETVVLLAGAAVLGVEAGVAAAQARPSWLAQLQDASERDGWLLRAESLEAREGFAEDFRDIDISTLELLRIWRLPWGLDFQFGGGPLVARGETSEPLSPEPPADSDTWGLQLGPGLRLRSPQWQGLSVHAETSLHLLWTTNPFPPHGTRFNGLIRRGFGLSYAFGHDHALEAGYRSAHVSNGSGINPDNPSWDGEGFWLGWKASFDGD